MLLGRKLYIFVKFYNVYMNSAYGNDFSLSKKEGGME